MEKLPDAAQFVLKRLNGAGFSAFAVGGCVRDMLLARSPHDVDIATSAMPDQVAALFADCHVIPTGMHHGTLTVSVRHNPVEVTAFRADGDYSDGRRPDEVTFGVSLERDLSRRDFTVNAMAYHPDVGLVDPFGGERDLRARVLRCVGNPFDRFAQDALRILRLVRFASVLGFSVDPSADRAAHALRKRLSAVSAERKRDELFRLLCGKKVVPVALAYADILCETVPGLSPAVGFDQHSPYHDFDVYTHSVRAVGFTDSSPEARLAALMHDMGKPECFTLDERGNGHFYGHAERSAIQAEQALKALKTDHRTVSSVVRSVRYHHVGIQQNRPCVRRWLSRLGMEELSALLRLQEADAYACRENPSRQEIQRLLQAHGAVLQLARDIQRENDCLKVTDLALNGDDLIALGVPQGKAIGDILRKLLLAVMEDKCPNEREALIRQVKGYMP